MITRRGPAFLTTLVLGFSFVQGLSAGELRMSSRGRPLHRPVSFYQADTPAESGNGLDDRLDGGNGAYSDPYAPMPVDDVFVPLPMAGVGGDLWAQFDFLMWWQRGMDVPPLATTSTSGTSLEDAGVLGLSSTSILFGGEQIGDEARPGGRLRVGYWLDPYECNGIEGRFFALGDATASFFADETIQEILARPFFNVSTGMEDARVVAFPSQVTGSMNIDATTSLLGMDLLFRRNLSTNPCQHLDLLVGYQAARLDSELVLATSTTSIATGGSIPVGTLQDSQDLFSANNEFHGVTVGMLAAGEQGSWSWEALAKVGLGRVQQDVVIAGITTTTVPGVDPVVTPAGLLAQPTNSGTFRQSQFAVLPEINLNLHCHINEYMDVVAGYSFLYINHVALAGEQIDVQINPTQIPGPIVGEARPAFRFQDSEYWAHGVNLGVRGRY